MKENTIQNGSPPEKSASLVGETDMSGTSPSSAGRSAPILLVEGNKDDEILAQRFFRRNEIAEEIVIRRTGDDAVNYLLQQDLQGAMPALVLIDLRLQRGGGFDL